MRKLVYQMLTSLDGYFEGPRREIDWHNVDEEFNAYAINLLNNAGALLFGRVTYELMAGFWPKYSGGGSDAVVAERMNNLPKVVFSRTLARVEWSNTRLVATNVPEEVAKLKELPGKDLLMLASSDLAVSLLPHGLIDEFQIIVNPVILGGGKSLFRGLDRRYRLKLVQAKPFSSGNVILYYVPAPSAG